jgi:hypothetical protein
VIARLLLKDEDVDPSANENSALINACKERKYKIVQMLLEDDDVDSSVDNYRALRVAKENNDSLMIDILNGNYDVSH